MKYIFKFDNINFVNTNRPGINLQWDFAQIFLQNLIYFQENKSAHSTKKCISGIF